MIKDTLPQEETAEVFLAEQYNDNAKLHILMLLRVLDSKSIRCRLGVLAAPLMYI